MTESLARLAPKTQSLEGMPPGQGGMTPMDIAASLAGTGEVALDRADAKRDLVLAIYSGYPTTEVLHREVVTVCRKYIHREMPDYYSGIMVRVSALAIGESVLPRTCWRCGGTGELRGPYKAVQECHRCLGTGLGTVREREASEWLRISRRRWRSTYQYPYSQVLGTLNQWQGEVIGRSRRNLYG